MTKQGFVMLHRTIQKHWLYEEKRKFSKYEAWLDLLMMVNYKDNKIVQDGKLIEVKRGERITSVRQLMDRWDWSNTKVMNFLNLLSQDEMITYEITPKKKTLIKILKYHEYQGFQEVDQSEEKTQNTHRTTTETTQNNINNKDNKANKEKKEPSSPKFSTSDTENAKLLFEKMKENNPGIKEPKFDDWSNEFRLIRERDERTDKQVKYLINWTQNDVFWRTTILSPGKLRKQWDQLVGRAKAEDERKKQMKVKREIDWSDI